MATSVRVWPFVLSPLHSPETRAPAADLSTNSWWETRVIFSLLVSSRSILCLWGSNRGLAGSSPCPTVLVRLPVANDRGAAVVRWVVVIMLLEGVPPGMNVEVFVLRVVNSRLLLVHTARTMTFSLGQCLCESVVSPSFDLLGSSILSMIMLGRATCSRCLVLVVDLVLLTILKLLLCLKE